MRIALLIFITLMSGIRGTLAMTLNFTNPQDASYWEVINDTVMGGLSQSQVEIRDDKLHFSGKVSLENNGGFASTRRPLSGLSAEQVSLKLKGDGRAYKLRIYAAYRNYVIAYSSPEFSTQSSEWKTLKFSEKDFTAVFRGRPIPNAPALDFDLVRGIGFIIADKRSGKFSLLVDEINFDKKT